MIEIFRRHGSRWRIKIVNETLEFENTKKFEEIILKLTKIKEEFEPYKNGEKKRKDKSFWDKWN